MRTINTIIQLRRDNDYNFEDLYENSWSGAIDTLNIIIKNDMEDELMEHLEEIFIK